MNGDIVVWADNRDGPILGTPKQAVGTVQTTDEISMSSTSPMDRRGVWLVLERSTSVTAFASVSFRFLS